MILVDANLLLYAEDSLSTHHETARNWWDEPLSGTVPVCLCSPVVTTFIRIATNTRLQQRPLTIEGAVERVQGWIDQPRVRMIQPTDLHWKILQRMLHEGSATANLVSDARLAALAIEHNCELCSTDGDFARFPGLRWRHPVGNR